MSGFEAHAQRPFILDNRRASPAAREREGADLLPFPLVNSQSKLNGSGSSTSHTDDPMDASRARSVCTKLYQLRQVAAEIARNVHLEFAPVDRSDCMEAQLASLSVDLENLRKHTSLLRSSPHTPWSTCNVATYPPYDSGGGLDEDAISLPPPQVDIYRRRNSPSEDRQSTSRASGGSSAPGSIYSSSPSSLLASPNLIQKVTSKVQRMLIKENSDTTGPLTVRRNSGASRFVADTAIENLVIPETLKQGINFLRVTHKKRVQRVLKLDEETGVLSWNSKLTSRLSIDRISEIYTGEYARNYREEFKVSAELANRWATIIHQQPRDTRLRALHIIVTTQNEFDMLMGTVKQLLAFRREIMSGLARAGPHFVNVHWSRNSGTKHKLSFEQFQHLTKQLHVHCAPETLHRLFDEADVDNSHYLDFSEFQRLVDILKRRDDILAIFEEHAQDGVIGRSAFELFVRNVQGENWTSEYFDRVFGKYSDPDSETMSSKQFSESLLSSSVFPPVIAPVENLDGPLNEYWISSSHNTYLTGKQVGSGSTVEGYIRSLQDGCRCLEIDVWDGAHGPVVHHGSTVAKLSGSLEFSDIIHAVLKYGFITSPFPLLLSLEIHCKEENQLKMVETLRSVLGDQLVTRPLLPGSFSLPSPNDLKHKVLVKVKAGISGPWSPALSSDTVYSVSSGGGGDEEDVSSSASTATPRKTSSVCPELAQLGVYLSARKFKDFSSPESKQVNHTFSFSERAVKSLVKNHQQRRALEIHNRKYLARVYPSGLRLRSTNFDPIQFWRLGFQMVALNWQTSDIGMQINKAFHAPHVGYVHKPAWMRPSTAETLWPARRVRILVRIVSAQQLPRPKALKGDEVFSPYVKVDFFGLTGTQETHFKTEPVVNNGFNPQWNYDCAVDIPESDLQFACVSFSISVGASPFAIYTAKLAHMRPGYRHLPLQDLNGEDYIFSSLFIRIDRTISST